MGEYIEVCDKETRINFRWSHVLEGISIIMLIGLGTVVMDMRDSTLESERLHANIPDGFFTKERYGLQDANRDRKYNEDSRHVLDQRITALEQAILSHTQEAEVWKGIIRDIQMENRQTLQVLYAHINKVETRE